MKIVGKNMYVGLSGDKACNETVEIDFNGQLITVYCYSYQDHFTYEHEGTISVELEGDTFIVNEVSWLTDNKPTIEENRGGIAKLLLSKIPSVNDVAFDWPCDCDRCPEMQNKQWSLHTTIVTLNDTCHWGRTPEENSEKNIIDWLDSLPFDFTIKD